MRATSPASSADTPLGPPTRAKAPKTAHRVGKRKRGRPPVKARAPELGKSDFSNLNFNFKADDFLAPQPAMRPTVTEWAPIPFILGGADLDQPGAGPSRPLKPEAPALDALAFWEMLGDEVATPAPPIVQAPPRAPTKTRSRAPDVRSNTALQGPIEAHGLVTARYNRTPIEYRAAVAPPLVGRKQANALREDYRIKGCPRLH